MGSDKDSKLALTFYCDEDGSVSWNVGDGGVSVTRGLNEVAVLKGDADNGDVCDGVRFVVSNTAATVQAFYLPGTESATLEGSKAMVREALAAIPAVREAMLELVISGAWAEGALRCALSALERNEEAESPEGQPDG